MRAWRSPLFLFAVLLSLLLHLAATLGEPVLLWLESDDLGATPLIKPAKRKLLGQNLAEDADGPAGLAGVTPADQLTVRLGKARQPAQPAAVATARPVPTPQRETPPAAARPTVPVGTITPPPTVAINPPPAPTVTSTAPPASEAGKAAEVTAVANAEAAKTPPATPETPAANSKPARPGLDSSFPRTVDISYIVKGLVLADHRWRLDGKQYRISTQGSLFGKAFDMRTEGEVGPAGLRPKRFIEYRDQKPQPKYEVDFDWAGKKVLVGEPGQQKEFALDEGAQDIFSAAYQFALQGNKLPSFHMQIVTGRNSYQIDFELKGEAELTLSGQKVNTLVLAGAHDKRRFEFYLAPDWHNLPVRIRYQDGDNTIDLVTVQLTLDGKTVLKRTERLSRDR
ncbi:DUF3108 domain-containing protein [Chitinimonas naiadis]